MGSLKLKLVVYFSLIALLPFAAALSGLQSITDRSETRRADGILETGVRAGLARFSDEVASAQRRAAELARDPSFQRALSRRDRRVLRRALAKQPNLRLEARGLNVGFHRAARDRAVGRGPGPPRSAWPGRCRRATRRQPGGPRASERRPWLAGRPDRVRP